MSVRVSLGWLPEEKYLIKDPSELREDGIKSEKENDNNVNSSKRKLELSLSNLEVPKIQRISRFITAFPLVSLCSNILFY
jgi:hypothetical protein